MQATNFAETVQTTLNFRGHLRVLDRPIVMGILNLTPDSFSDGGKYAGTARALDRIGEMLDEGAGIIDIGGASTRLGAAVLTPEEEWGRISEVLKMALERFPDAIFSIDTYHAFVAGMALGTGAHAINDISGGIFDPAMLQVVAQYGDAPFLLMHIRGGPHDMHQQPPFKDVVAQVYEQLVERVCACRQAGIRDLVVDPGFGFGKTMADNYALLRNLDKFQALGLPVLVGISRKSMIYKLFSTSPSDIADLTAALHFQALQLGAGILRVHDVKETVRLVQLHQYWKNGTL